MGRIDSLQALRFFAALAVVVNHSMRQALETAGVHIKGVGKLDIGAAGVDVFFVLSGFIIVRSVLSKGRSAPEFWFARWWRVAPVYILLSLPFIWFATVAGTFTWDRLAATLTFWPVYDQVVSPYLLVGWTLCFEALFYFAVGLTLIGRRWIGRVLIIFIAAMAGRVVLGWPLFQFIGNPIILEFLAGVGLALWWNGERRPTLGALAALMALGLIALWLIAGPSPILGGRVTLTGATSLERVVWIGVPATLLVYSALQFEGKWGALPYLGDASYALYLVHSLVLVIVHALPMLPIVEFVASVVLSVLAAILIYEKVERPILRSRPGRATTQPA